MRLDVNEPEHIIQGLVDGGQSTIKCSSCQVALVDIWITRANVDLPWKIKAGCPYCGDGKPAKEHGSYWVSFKGGLHYGATDKCVPEKIELVEDDKGQLTGEVLITSIRVK